MKKSLILAALAIAVTSVANASVDVPGHGQTVSWTSLTESTQPVPGKKYLIYDNVKLNADGTTAGSSNDQGALCFRGVRTDDNVITGNTSLNPTNAASVDAHLYVWTAGGADNAVTFKNEFKNMFIPAAADATMDLSSTAGVFEFVTHATGFIVKNTSNNYVWDGDNGGRNPAYRMVGWSKQNDMNDNHTYRFFEITEEMLSDNNKCEIVYVTRVGNVETLFYHDYVEPNSAMPMTPNAESYTAPENFPTIVTEPGRYVFTLNPPAGSKAVKIVNAYNNSNGVLNDWIGVNGNNLCHGLVAETFYQVDTENGFKLWSPSANKWVGSIGSDVGTLALVEEAQAQELQITRLPDGTEAISNYGNNDLNTSYFINLRSQGALGSWNVTSGGIDNGCRFFMIYDEEIFNANLTYYTIAYRAWAGQFYTALQTAKEYKQMLGTRSDDAVTALDNAIAGADAVRFGKESVGSYVTALTNATNAFPLIPAILTAQGYTVGTALNQYTYADGDFAQILSGAQTLLRNSDATEDDVNSAIAALSPNKFTINQPTARRYYRLHYGNKYLTSSTNGNKRLAIATEGNANNLNDTTVFYFDGEYLVSFPEGKVIGNITSGNADNGSYSTVLSTSEYAGTIAFVGSTHHLGYYNIKISENRYLYHGDNQIDAADGTDGDTGYCWQFSEVQWLPVPHDETNGHLTLCVPAYLNITQHSRAQHHFGVIQDDKFGKKIQEDAILPANTPALLSYNSGIEHGCVYFNITGYPEISAQSDDYTDLQATSYLATSKPENDGYKYYVVNNNSFVEHTDDVIPANAAILKVSNTHAKASYEIADYDATATSIAEIDAVQNDSEGIFDLQGRRVAKAAKGIYIINGKKTLVK